MAEIDSRRDLTAQYVGELQVAYDKIQQQLTAPAEGRGDAVDGPAAPVPRRARMADDGPDWQPVRPGRRPAWRKRRQKRHRDRLDGRPAGPGGARRDGRPTPMRSPAWARWSSSTTAATTTPSTAISARSSVQTGATVETGAEIGRVGASPAGPPALYFELRIDGKPIGSRTMAQASVIQRHRSCLMTSRTRLWVLAISTPVIAFALVGGYLGQAMAKDDTYQHLRVFEDVVTLVVNNYVEEVDVKQAMRGAMRGLADGARRRQRLPHARTGHDRRKQLERRARGRRRRAGPAGTTCASSRRARDLRPRRPASGPATSSARSTTSPRATCRRTKARGCCAARPARR